MTENAGYSGDIEKLTQLVKTYAPHDGSFELPIKGARVSHIDPSPISGIAHAGLCIVAQWSKRVFLGNKKTYEYDRSRMVVYSMTLPIEGPVLQASLHEPYLCLVLDITPKKNYRTGFKGFSAWCSRGTGCWQYPCGAFRRKNHCCRCSVDGVGKES